MTRKAKRSSAANHDGSGLLGSAFGRRSAATPASTPAPKGLVRPHTKLLALLAISLLALFATAASASAAPPSTEMGAITDISYTSAQVTGKVTTDGSAPFGGSTAYVFQYSSDEGATWKAGLEGNLSGPQTNKDVGGPLSVPKGGTKYLVRLVASNGFFVADPPEAVSPGPNPEFTTLAVDPPTIPGTVEATDVFSLQATAIAKVKRPANSDAAFDITCRFEYITDDQYKANELAAEPLFQGATPVDCAENPITKDTVDPQGEQVVTAAFVGLTPSTTYHLRLVAENAAPGGPVVKEAANFTTAPKVTAPTVTAVNDASEVKFNIATLTGKVLRPAGADPALNVNCHFEYVTDAAFNPLSEQQKLTITGATGGSYILYFAGEPTSPIAFDASAGDVQAALESLGAIGAGNVTLSGAYTIDFTGALADKDVEQVFVDPTGLEEAGVAGAETTTVTEGHAGGFENPGIAPCEQNPITAAKVDAGGEIEASAKAGTVATTKYHFRLVAENEGGSDTMDAANTFTTPEAELPTVTIDPVEGGTFTTAHVTGTVTLADGHTTAQETKLQVSSDNGATWSLYPMLWSRDGQEYRLGDIRAEPLAEGLYFVKADITGLQPSTSYLFRIASTYSGLNYPLAEANGEVAFSPEPNPEITTEAPQAPPTAENLAVTDVTATSAHFSGTVNPHAPAGPLSGPAKKAYETKWHFECAPECKDRFGNEIGGTVQGEEGPQPVAADVEGLDPNTEYEVTLVAHSEGGDGTDSETFSTKLIKPTVKAIDGGSDGEGGYTIAGVVNPNGSPVTDCKFEWGPTAPKYAFEVDCSPMPVGRNEVQEVTISATEGQFRLTYRGQTTTDIAVGSTAAVVESELEALSLIGPNLTVTGGPDPAHPYVITFGGSLAEKNLAQIQAQGFGLGGQGSQTGLSFSTKVEGGASFFTTVEAHLTGLNPNVDYHYNLLATNAAGTEESKDQVFKPTLATKEPCPANEQLRVENSSLALPECRAYEVVSPPGKEGFGAKLETYDGGDQVGYRSEAGNLAKSGQGAVSNSYVAARTTSGWQTIPNLNGSSGSILDAPSHADGVREVIAYSQNLLSSVWWLHRQGEPGGDAATLAHLRSPDGTFALIGNFGSQPFIPLPVAASADLSHLLVWGWTATENYWGPGVYEFLGTGMDQPRRVDLDNSGTPISTCLGTGQAAGANAVFLSLSSDASTVVNLVFGGCGGSNPPADELWARVNGTTAVDVSASHCTRLDCNAPANPTFQGAASDGSRVFFTTTQQLVDDDTDQANDLYACDLPAGNPAPSADKANHCAAFRQVSVAEVGAAEVESVFARAPGTFGYELASGFYPGVSDDGSTVLFTAKGVLADNKDALGEKALAGDHNLYAWRADASHPDGQTSFVAKLDSDDLSSGFGQVTPDGRYLVFTTANQLLDTDTDTARDVYRYDVDAGELTRVSTNVFGVAGNGDFNAQIGGPREHNPTATVSDDGQKIVFTTTEPLNLAVDNNDEPDVYLWTPARVSLISTGSSGFAPRERSSGTAVNPGVAISGSGQDIYFESPQALTPADGDDSTDVYDARIGGGFSFVSEPVCTGEKCQPDPAPAPPKKAPLSAQPGPGNPTPPKPCPKGKVRNKKGKCVKKPKKHSGKKHHGKKASHKQGGGK